MCAAGGAQATGCTISEGDMERISHLPVCILDVFRTGQSLRRADNTSYLRTLKQAVLGDGTAEQIEHSKI